MAFTSWWIPNGFRIFKILLLGIQGHHLFESDYCLWVSRIWVAYLRQIRVLFDHHKGKTCNLMLGAHKAWSWSACKITHFISIFPTKILRIAMWNIVYSDLVLDMFVLYLILFDWADILLSCKWIFHGSILCYHL